MQLSGSDERPPVAPDVLARVRGVDGVAAAEGHVSGYALIVGADGKPIQPSGAPTLGLSVAADPALRAELTVQDGRVPTAPGEVAIDASSARKGELGVGSRTTVLFQDRQRTFTVVGVVGFGDRDDLGGATTAYFDLPTAQRVLGERGVFDDLRVRGADGVSPTELAARVRSVLPAHTEALTGAAVAEEQSDAAKEGLGFLSVALMGFAGVALFVGAFIIWNTFSMQVAQRTRELALLRAIGATRRQVLRALVAESLLLGLVSSLVGVLLGMALAGGLGALMAAFGFSLPTAGIRLTSQALVVGVLVGTVGDGRLRDRTGAAGDEGAARRGAAGRGPAGLPHQQDADPRRPGSSSPRERPGCSPPCSAAPRPSWSRSARSASSSGWPPWRPCSSGRWPR